MNASVAGSATRQKVKEDDADGDGEGDFQLKGPLVFQCVKCLAILGDSFAWKSAEKQLKTVTLCVKSDTALVCDDVQTSTSGFDSGSTYSWLKCERCGEMVGKKYLTTPRSLDHIRDMYSFHSDALKIYHVGGALDANTSAEDDVMDLPTAQSVQHTLRKVQGAILVLNDRIRDMEQRFSTTGQPYMVAPPPMSSFSSDPLYRDSMQFNHAGYGYGGGGRVGRHPHSEHNGMAGPAIYPIPAHPTGTLTQNWDQPPKRRRPS